MNYAYELELKPGLLFHTNDADVAAAFLKGGYTALIDALLKKGKNDGVAKLCRRIRKQNHR